MTETTKKTNKILSDDQQCIWMKAGVINYKLCPYSYACNLCAFDKAMREAGRQTAPQKRRVPWTERLRTLSGPEKYCRHMLQGLVSYKLCPHNYECGTCQYDQMVLDSIIESGLPRLRRVAGFTLPVTYHFHQKHAWVNVEYGGKCRVGFDDFACQLLGQERNYDLPRIGQKVAQSEPFMAVKTAEQTFELEAPVDGVITDINPLQDRPDELLPYSDGWMAFIEPTKRMPANLKKLHYGDNALEWMTESADRLIEYLSPGAPLAADGGIITAELYANLPAAKRAGAIEKVLLAG